MDFKPFLDAGFIIQLHIIAAFLAIFIGVIILWRRKGTTLHKSYGKIWVALLAIVALSSFFINEIQTFGPFSAIHILSILTLYSLVRAIIHVKNGRIQKHQVIMKGLFYGGLIGAGIFTFMPGRILYRTFFGKPEFYIFNLSNVWIMPVGFALIVGIIIYWRAKKAA